MTRRAIRARRRQRGPLVRQKIKLPRRIFSGEGNAKQRRSRFRRMLRDMGEIIRGFKFHFPAEFPLPLIGTQSGLWRGFRYIPPKGKPKSQPVRYRRVEKRKYENWCCTFRRASAELKRGANDPA